MSPKRRLVSCLGAARPRQVVELVGEEFSQAILGIFQLECGAEQGLGGQVQEPAPTQMVNASGDLQSRLVLLKGGGWSLRNGTFTVLRVGEESGAER
jgi:hypothetical protein